MRTEAARAELRADSSDDPTVGAAGIDDPDAGAPFGAELADFDPAEFAEFLAADDDPVAVDPAFRERLRNQLWSMVRERADAVRPRGAGMDARPRTPQSDPKPRR